MPKAYLQIRYIRICHDAYEKEYSGRPGWMETYAMPDVRV